eukprot:1160680-Pelagomonas_calceolata.AAC.2
MQSSQLKQPSKFTQARYSRVEDKRKPKGSKKDPRQSIACSQLESQFSKQAPFDEHIFSMQDITFRDNAQKAQGVPGWKGKLVTRGKFCCVCPSRKHAAGAAGGVDTVQSTLLEHDLQALSHLQGFALINFRKCAQITFKVMMALPIHAWNKQVSPAGMLRPDGSKECQGGHKEALYLLPKFQLSSPNLHMWAAIRDTPHNQIG